MIKGKILSVTGLDYIISHGYKLRDNCDYYIVEDKWFGLFSQFALLRRVLRAEISGLYNLFNGDRVAIAKKGLFLQKKGYKNYKLCFAIPRGSKPLNLCISPSGYIYFGEYFQNIGKQAVNIYCSKDNAQTWNVVYTFEAGNINHIHGLFFDKYTNYIWVTTGDRDNECIIGYTEDEFKTFVIVFRGSQEYRTCQLFFYKDFIVFGTDSQYEQNMIKMFNRITLEVTELQQIQGSVIKGGQVGNISFISTTVEPSKVNTDRYSHIWVTKDGTHWEERFKAKKDCLPFLFQFGTFEFPQYNVDKLDRLYFTGRALKSLDGKTAYIDL